MKKISLIFSCIFLIACAKKETSLVAPSIDYGAYKPKQIIHSTRNYSGSTVTYSLDTLAFTYKGSNISYVLKRNGRVNNDYNVVLENGIYTEVFSQKGVLSPQKIYYRLNASGLIDSTWLTSNDKITQGGSYKYNADGTKDFELYNYTNYINTKKYSYKNETAVQAIIERISYLPSIPPAKDSVVFEYTTLPYRADFSINGMPISRYGKPEKYLIKKATYYNKLDNNALRQTYEYSYQTNEIGLTSKKIMNIYTQPGNVLLLTDTIAYSYQIP